MFISTFCGSFHFLSLDLLAQRFGLNLDMVHSLVENWVEESLIEGELKNSFISFVPKDKNHMNMLADQLEERMLGMNEPKTVKGR